MSFLEILHFGRHFVFRITSWNLDLPYLTVPINKSPQSLVTLNKNRGKTSITLLSPGGAKCLPPHRIGLTRGLTSVYFRKNSIFGNAAFWRPSCFSNFCWNQDPPKLTGLMKKAPQSLVALNKNRGKTSLTLLSPGGAKCLPPHLIGLMRGLSSVYFRKNSIFGNAAFWRPSCFSNFCWNQDPPN